MPHRTTRIVGVLAALALAGTLAACADDATEEPGGAADNGTQPGDTEAAGGTSVATAETDLGTILVDEQGRTLYLFTQDSPGTSNCTDECLETWPILEGEATAGEGVDEALLGTLERPDGTTQTTYNDHPLYYYTQDTAPNDVNGQGVDETWWVLDTQGNPIKQTPEQDNGDGYGGY